jgi:site-specific DNA recombinase
VKEGYTLASNNISYGYDRPKGQKVQTINPCESAIVKEIFSMYVNQNYSLNKIARVLNERKIPTKKGLGIWNSANIRAILSNPTYIGKVRYSTLVESKYFEVEGHHERLLDDEVFFLAQERLKNTAQKSQTKTPREQSYFCGTLICGECGDKFTTHNYRANSTTEEYKTSYRCRTKSSFCVDKCKSPNITHAKVEIAFLDYIQNINDLTATANIEPVDNAEQDLLKSIVDIEKKLNTMQNRKNQVMEQYMEGIIEFDEYRRMIEVFDNKTATIDSELQRKKDEIANLTSSTELFPEDVITNIQQNWEQLSNVEKGVFLNRFVKTITITTEKIYRSKNKVRIDSVEFH